jgi:hypothetical protein
MKGNNALKMPKPTKAKGEKQILYIRSICRLAVCHIKTMTRVGMRIKNNPINPTNTRAILPSA